MAAYRMWGVLESQWHNVKIENATETMFRSDRGTRADHFVLTYADTSPTSKGQTGIREPWLA